MIDNLSIRVTGLLLNRQIIKEEDQDIYIYGFELLFSTIMNVILVIAIGSIFDQLPQTIFFLLEYCSVKRYAGGYHAKTHGRCIITFGVLYTFMLVVFKLSAISEGNAALYVLSFLSIIVIFHLAPVEDVNKPLDAVEKNLFSLRCRQLTILISIINLLLYLCIGNRYGFLLFGLAAQIWVGTAVLVGFVINKRRCPLC